MPFADLHCHPSFWSFNKTSDPTSREKTHIWDVTLNKCQLRRMEEGKRATYAQSDINSLMDGDVRLVFASLYPVERGFFLTNKKKGRHAKALLGIFNMIFSFSSKKWRFDMSVYLWPLNRMLSRMLNKDGWTRDIVQKHIMNFSIDRIKEFRSKAYDYFEALEAEYQFYKKDSGKFTDSLKHPAYKLIKNNVDLGRVLGQTQAIAMVMTMEGFHSICLGVDAKDNTLKLLSNEKIEERIKTIKEKWKIFFITFSHHYSNQLAGHAHSLPLLLTEVTDQESMMNKGLSCEGEKYMRKLLSITNNNEDDRAAGRRVLIDVKHLSALSRKQYYNRIITKYNRKHKKDKIPVIASHCGYYGPVQGFPYVDLDYLQVMAKYEDDDCITDGFYRWNINLCDEDVKVIVMSEGLIGLSFDQRIMGERDPHEKSLQYWINVIGRQVLAFVASAIQHVEREPHRIWKCLCIGTDFDGLIDPVDSFSTARKFITFKAELLRFLNVISETRGRHFFLKGNPYTPEEVVERITFSNLSEFTLEHFK